MKKILVLLIVLMGISYAANAQSCKIRGADDGSTVMVTNHWLDGSKVFVNLENDSEKTCANVTVKVEIKYVYRGNHVVGGPGPKTKAYEGYGTSCPNGTCKVEIPILLDINEYGDCFEMREYKVLSVSGNKCN
jgi:hypothetical protein